MNKITVNDPASRSPDVTAENFSRLRALFPELVTEGADGVAVNLDVLKQLIGDKMITDTEEKYGLNWHGKRRARQLALMPSAGTLRPCPEDSVDWDTTKNLMIEGDNLEVLKLLQKSYAGKVKLTGKRATQKEYYRNTGYPGGARFTKFSTAVEDRPEFVIEHAVKGMLPKTALGAKMIKKLKVYGGADHPHTAQTLAPVSH